MICCWKSSPTRKRCPGQEVCGLLYRAQRTLQDCNGRFNKTSMWLAGQQDAEISSNISVLWRAYVFNQSMLFQLLYTSPDAAKSDVLDVRLLWAVRKAWCMLVPQHSP